MPDDPKNPYQGPAGGWGALAASAEIITRGKKPSRVASAALLRVVNQKDGFDCPGCAWPDPHDHRSAFEFCENGVKAVVWESTSKRVRRRLLCQAHRLRTPQKRATTGWSRKGAWSIRSPTTPRPTTLLPSPGPKPSRRSARPCGRWTIPTRRPSTPPAPRQQRSGVPLSALRPHVRHQQPAGTVRTCATKSSGVGLNPDHRNWEGDRLARGLR